MPTNDNRYTIQDFIDEILEVLNKDGDHKKAILFLISQRRPLLRAIGKDCERMAEIHAIVKSAS